MDTSTTIMSQLTDCKPSLINAVAYLKQYKHTASQLTAARLLRQQTTLASTSPPPPSSSSSSSYTPPGPRHTLAATAI
jgi:hypothetical protein